jgi:hypothetical protein
MRQVQGLIRGAGRGWLVLAGAVAALLVPAVLAAAAGADPIVYKVNSTTVPSKPLQAPPAHNGTVATCPGSHPNLTGGGALLSRLDPNIQLWSTDLLETEVWGATASNIDTGHPSDLDVTAICAKRGKFSYPEEKKEGDPGLQVAKGVNCPPGKRLTGGGVDGQPIDLSQKRRGGIPAPEIAASFPQDGPDENSKRDDRWVGAVGRGDITVDAVCAKKVGTLKYVQSDSRALPSGSGVGSATARCPVGAQVTGGGANTTGIDPGLKVVASTPDTTGTHDKWQVFATNSSGEDEEVQAFAICRA